MASRKSCIVHYEIKNEKYSGLGNISENAYQRILEAKTIREELGGANFHREQFLTLSYPGGGGKIRPPPVFPPPS